MNGIIFALGAAMLGWDLAGHACCAIARLVGPAGARAWNAYAGFIWPRLSDSLTYDLFWTAWHGTALALMAAAFIRRGAA